MSAAGAIYAGSSDTVSRMRAQVAKFLVSIGGLPAWTSKSRTEKLAAAEASLRQNGVDLPFSETARFIDMVDSYVRARQPNGVRMQQIVRPAGAQAVEYTSQRAGAMTRVAGARSAGVRVFRAAARVPYQDTYLGKRAPIASAPAGDAVPNPFDYGLSNPDAQNLMFGDGTGKGSGSDGSWTPSDISSLISAIGQVGIGVTNTVLNQMNRDQMLQLQRDTLARRDQMESLGGTPQSRAATNALLGQLQARLDAQQGMSTTTMLVIGGVGLAALYLLTQRRRARNNPVIGRGRRRRYVRPGRR